MKIKKKEMDTRFSRTEVVLERRGSSKEITEDEE